jgi:hypothetical protein
MNTHTRAVFVSIVTLLMVGMTVPAWAGATFDVAVVDQDGNGIESADVELWKARGGRKSGSAPLATGTTDENGDVQIESPLETSSHYIIAASKSPLRKSGSPAVYATATTAAEAIERRNYVAPTAELDVEVELLRFELNGPPGGPYEVWTSSGNHPRALAVSGKFPYLQYQPLTLFLAGSGHNDHYHVFARTGAQFNARGKAMIVEFDLFDL